MVKRVRKIENLESENERLEQLIKKKEDEIHKAEQRIRRNRELISKKKEMQDRTINTYVEECTLVNNSWHTVIRIIDTGEKHPYWGHETPGTYIKITSRFLEELRDCKQKRDSGYFKE